MGVSMEAIMIAAVAVLAVSGWYSLLDLLAEIGIRNTGRGGREVSTGVCFSSCRIPAQRRVKQMAGVNI